MNHWSDLLPGVPSLCDSLAVLWRVKRLAQGPFGWSERGVPRFSAQAALVGFSR